MLGKVIVDAFSRVLDQEFEHLILTSLDGSVDEVLVIVELHEWRNPKLLKESCDKLEFPIVCGPVLAPGKLRLNWSEFSVRRFPYTNRRDFKLFNSFSLLVLYQRRITNIHMNLIFVRFWSSENGSDHIHLTSKEV